MQKFTPQNLLNKLKYYNNNNNNNIIIIIIFFFKKHWVLLVFINVKIFCYTSSY
jgi:hypothetical protein